MSRAARRRGEGEPWDISGTRQGVCRAYRYYSRPCRGSIHPALLPFQAVTQRLLDSNSSVILTTDAGIRGGKKVTLLSHCPATPLTPLPLLQP